MDALWNTVDELTPDECRTLLARHSFGRVGLSVDALPVVLPVNYVFDGDRIVVRTGRGSKLTVALRNAVVCFEIDGVDLIGGVGWSVLVTGTAAELQGHDAVRAAALPLRSWSPTVTDHLVGIGVDLVTGRRVGSALAVGWG